MCSVALLNLVEIFPILENVFLNVVNLVEKLFGTDAKCSIAQTLHES